jgi:hypothetical protein
MALTYYIQEARYVTLKDALNSRLFAPKAID